MLAQSMLNKKKLPLAIPTSTRVPEWDWKGLSRKEATAAATPPLPWGNHKVSGHWAGDQPSAMPSKALKCGMHSGAVNVVGFQ